MASDRVRFYVDALKFPERCSRCGASTAPRQTTLLRPKDAWFGRNAVVNAPVCLKCWCILGAESWIALLLFLSIGYVALRFISKWTVLALIRLPHGTLPVGDWLQSETFISVLVGILLIGIYWPLGHLQTRALRDLAEMKVSITDFKGDWVELEGNDAKYFADLCELSKDAIVEPDYVGETA